jgi:predicted transcriptional regulator
MINAMGGKCCLCGYCKCSAALDLHHKDPSQKEIQFGKVIANPRAWIKIVAELRKCVLVCANCHREIHRGLATVPPNAPQFDESYLSKPSVDQIFVPTSEMDACPICNSSKPVLYKTCSKKCAALIVGTIQWEKFDVLSMKKSGMSNRQIASLIGCSDTAISKRLMKLGFQSTFEEAEILMCQHCKVEPVKHGRRFCSDVCWQKFRRRVERPPKEDLLKMVSEMSYKAVGRVFGVSDNAVRKWIKHYEKI